LTKREGFRHRFKRIKRIFADIQISSYNYPLTTSRLVTLSLGKGWDRIFRHRYKRIKRISTDFPSTNNQQPSTINHQPSTTPPSTINQQPSTINQQPSTNNQQPTTSHPSTKF
jgi:hypothetical protein